MGIKMSKFFDPLSTVQVEQEALCGAEIASTSAVSVNNEVHGVCPKCGSPMDTTNITTPKMDGLEAVFWCGSCRVTTPKPI